MRVIIINLSPRPNGTSSMLVNYFEQNISSKDNEVQQIGLYSCMKNMEELLLAIKESDCIVMIGPCYVDSFPANTTYLLTKMAETEGILHGQSLYGMIQGGMPYVHTHEHGIRLLENFAAVNKVEYKGGFVMGGGAMLDGRPLEQAIGAKKIVPAVKKFILHIKKQEVSPDDLYREAEVKMPVIVTWLISVMMNKKIKKDLQHIINQ